MSKRKKIILISIAIIFVLIIIGSVIAAKKGKQPEYTTATVQYATLKQTVDATGKIESAEKIDLNFKTSGRIAQILVNVGDEIKSGQILARLEAGALQSNVTSAAAQVNQAQADYDKIIAGASAEDIKI